jgi:hypothetical protein
VLDAADVDDALPGPWEADLIALARTEASGAKAVLALAEAYQRAVGAVADEPLHAARAEAGRRARRLAAGVPRDAARSADTAVRRLVSSGTRLRRNRVAEGWSVRPGGSAEPPLSGSVADAPDPTVEMAQYRESLSEPGAQLLVQYALADAVVSDDGRMLALLARGADDVLLLEGRPVAPSTREPQWGAWRDGSDVHRVLLARETIPLVPVELGGWSTSADGSVARVWSRARIATESLALGGRRERARSLGTALGLIHAVNGDAAALAGYLGRSRAFPEALREAVA